MEGEPCPRLLVSVINVSEDFVRRLVFKFSSESQTTLIHYRRILLYRAVKSTTLLLAIFY